MAFAGSSAGPDPRSRRAPGPRRLSGRGRVFVGRDTRGSGPELEEALGGSIRRRERDPRRGAADSRRGAARSRSRGGDFRLSQPTPVQRRQTLRRRRPQADRRGRGGSRRFSTKAPARSSARSTMSAWRPTAISSTSSSCWERSVRAEDRRRLRKRGVPGIVPKAFERLGAEVASIAAAPGRREHQRRLRSDRPLVSWSEPSPKCWDSTSASRSTVMGIACLPWTRGRGGGRRPDPRDSRPRPWRRSSRRHGDDQSRFTG